MLPLHFALMMQFYFWNNMNMSDIAQLFDESCGVFINKRIKCSSFTYNIDKLILSLLIQVYLEGVLQYYIIQHNIDNSSLLHQYYIGINALVITIPHASPIFHHADVAAAQTFYWIIILSQLSLLSFESGINTKHFNLAAMYDTCMWMKQHCICSNYSISGWKLLLLFSTFLKISEHFSPHMQKVYSIIFNS